MFSGTSYINKKKIKEQGLLKENLIKKTLWIRDARSGIRKKFFSDPDPASRG
jgi:hypothetical protein